MISGTSSYIPTDVLMRPDAAVQNAPLVTDTETVLPPVSAVQQGEAASGPENGKQGASSPIISLSPELVTALQGNDENSSVVHEEDAPQQPKESSRDKPETSASGLTDAEEAQVDALKERDQEVRTHEQAHASSGGQYAGSPSYEYETGPNGQQYAVGGEVQIDTAAIAGDPAATIAKMDTVIKAALAPADPSGQDKAVAAAASQKRIEAQAELNALKQAERTGEVPEGGETLSEGAPVETSSGTGFVNPASTSGADTIIDLVA
ncbi:MAG: hypothetical protein JKX94_07835 [Sneathiella sp.]|nr:hypothetical protein [Sneathiella sp.]